MIDPKEITLLRSRYVELGKELAAAESTLASLKEARTKIEEKCKAIGVDPKDIASSIVSAKDNYDNLVASIKSKLYPSHTVKPAITPAGKTIIDLDPTLLDDMAPSTEPQMPPPSVEEAF
jgi:hypothetical protein